MTSTLAEALKKAAGAPFLVYVEPRGAYAELENMRHLMRSFHDSEQLLITTNPRLAEIDEENYSNSYKWLRFPIPDERPETVEEMILSGPEHFPNDCLAGILVAILKNRVPTGIQVSGIYIDRIENSFRFCISGSTSIEEIQTLCGQYELSHDFVCGTKSEM